MTVHNKRLMMVSSEKKLYFFYVSRDKRIQDHRGKKEKKTPTSPHTHHHPGQTFNCFTEKNQYFSSVKTQEGQ